MYSHTSLDKEKLHHTVRTFKNALPIEEYLIKTLEGQKVLERITDTSFLFSLFEMYTNKTLTPITIGDGLIVTTHLVPKLLTELESYLGSLGRLYTITGNVGSGHVSVITLFDPQSKKYEEDILLYAKNIFAIAKDSNAGISAVGGEGLARTPYLSYVYNDATLAVFQRIKNAWDPLSILNPGKKIGATTSYLEHHIRRATGK
jgi:FAD/FMN-containing dehydrogenase